MKPVRLPAAATIALPRWVIIALCALYILPGVIGLDPWKGEDAAGFGIMWSMAHGGLNDWLWPNIVGLPMSEEGPLAFWLGAICIKLFSWLLNDPLAARVSTVLCFALGASSVWHATFRLGRRAEAQPLKLAFGGEPSAVDFGRTLADGALLIYVGCLGLLLRSHETSAEALQIALIALAIQVCVNLFDQPQKRQALFLGFVLGLLVLTRGWVLPSALLLFLCILSRYRRQRVIGLLLGIALPIAALVSAIWLLPTYLMTPYGSSPIPGWMRWNLRQIGWLEWNNLIYLIRYTPWFTWPAWPFAVWSVYAWRKQERALHISLPLAFLFCFVLLALLNSSKEESLFLPMLPPLVMLAAFGLPTIKRSTINAIDWFSLMVFTGIAAFIWFGWIAEMSGWPATTAKRILSWAPGFQPVFQSAPFLIALLFSAAWFGLVYWRISRQPIVLWRAVVLSSGGVILSWLLLLTLWQPLINHRLTYAPVAAELSARLNVPYVCINSNAGPSQRAAFAYFGAIHFASFNQKDCEWYLAQTTRRSKSLSPALTQKLSPEKWEVVWQGHRAADKDELFSLYRKK